MKIEIKTPEEYLPIWLEEYYGGIDSDEWSNEEAMKFARDYNTYVQAEEEKWFAHKDNNEIEDLMKKVEKYLLKGSVIILRETAKKQGIQLPKPKRK